MKDFRTVTLADQVFERLEAEILSGKYQRGEVVTELQLCAELGVSRTPVREALIELSKTEIVTVYPQKGSRIAYIDEHLIEETQTDGRRRSYRITGKGREVFRDELARLKTCVLDGEEESV